MKKQKARMEGRVERVCVCVYFTIKNEMQILSISSPAEIKLLPVKTAFKEVI